MAAPAIVPVARELLQVPVNGRGLHVVSAGPKNAPLVLLLHGFPEGAHAWRHQIDVLARAGLRVWAPDQLGYGLSDKPRGLANYRLDRLGADVIGLIEAAGCTRASLIGHDWGGAVAWWVVENAPERIERLVVLNCPHPAVMRRALLTRPRQMLRSWYIAFFQLPWLPEFVASACDHRLLEWGLRSSCRPGTLTDADLEAYRADWRRPGSVRAMIHWYRALRLPVPRTSRPDVGRQPSGAASIVRPTLLIWGARDRALGRELAAPSIARCEAGRLVFLDDATHWLQHEEPARVNALILEHLGRDSSAA
jgi:pimeloyl-ACP methyl ester carboxylesterase